MCRTSDESIKYAPINQSLNNGHLRLLELLFGITAGGMGNVDGMADLDVVGQRDVLHLNTSLRKSSE